MTVYHYIMQLVALDFFPKRSDFAGKQQELDFFCFYHVNKTHLLAGKTLVQRSDHHNVTRIVQQGSRKKELQQEAIDVHIICRQENIRLTPEWVHRELNQWADAISNANDYDDFMLNPTLLQPWRLLGGPHSTDRFSSFRTCQISRSNSRTLCPGTEVIDAVTHI